MTENSAPATQRKDALEVLVYSDNSDVRAEVIQAVGRRVATELPEINFTEAATYEGTYQQVRDGNFDLLILDAETAKLGGIGMGKMVRDEIDPDIPYIILIARPQDEWLARVAKPEAILPFPVNPREISATVADILRDRVK